MRAILVKKGLGAYMLQYLCMWGQTIVDKLYSDIFRFEIFIVEEFFYFIPFCVHFILIVVEACIHPEALDGFHYLLGVDYNFLS